ncbi:MAG: GIDE domain-containing protein [Candidatus Micrarchaeota archaeon]
MNVFAFPILGFFFFFGLFIFYSGFKNWKGYLEISNLPTSKIRSLAVGIVEITGKVKPIKLLTSPTGKKNCVFYWMVETVLVKTRQEGGKINRAWVPTGVADKKFENFYIDDGTAKVEVNPNKAEILMPADYFFQGDVQNAALGTKRQIEYLIEPEQKIYLIGTAETKQNAKSAANANNLIILKGKNNPFYAISKDCEIQISKELKNQAKTGITIGIIVSAIALVFTFLSVIA